MSALRSVFEIRGWTLKKGSLKRRQICLTSLAADSRTDQ